MKCDACKHRLDEWCNFHKCKIFSIDADSCINFKECVLHKSNMIKKKAIKQEKRLAKDLGAKRTPQSGAKDTDPSDMTLGCYVIESKATKGKSMHVKEEWLTSLKQSPMHMGKIPTLILEFPSRRRYVVIDEVDFKNLIKEKENGNT